MLSEQPADFRRDSGVYRARQATALAAARRPDPDKAVEIAGLAAAACEETGSERLRAELTALPAHATAWAGSRHGRELAEIVAGIV